MSIILSVEDEGPVQELLKAILTPPHQVVAAADAAQGIELARFFPPDLVLLDLNLKVKWDGLEVCRTLRSDPDPSLAQVPIVMLTGQTGETDLKAAFAAGADSYVSKPYSPRFLSALIDTLLARGELSTVKSA
jgi:DNA-binding response OmpR family regulator